MSSAAPRFPIVPEAQWSDAQKALIGQYRQSWRGPDVAKDGKPIGGPLDATLRSPELAGHFARVSNYLRDGTVVPKKLKEFVIVLVSQFWKCDFEVKVHGPFAVNAGLAQATLDAVLEGRKPPAMAEDEAIVYQLVEEMLTTRELSDATFARAKAAFGEQQVVELVATAGYYCVVSLFLAMAKIK